MLYVHGNHKRLVRTDNSAGTATLTHTAPAELTLVLDIISILPELQLPEDSPQSHDLETNFVTASVVNLVSELSLIHI